jgi:hypothetical protein
MGALQSLWQLFLKWGDSALVALAGVLSVPAVQSVLTPFLGKWGALISAVMALVHMHLLPEPTPPVPKTPVTAKVLVWAVTLMIAASIFIASQRGQVMLVRLQSSQAVVHFEARAVRAWALASADEGA